jgi:actin related protein 2/3 complex, subunit 1A/1B
MASPEVHHLFHHPIADHSFSADRQMLAVARDTTVELYGRSGNTFKLKDELKGHDKTVTSVDIALSTGRIVTCSQGALRLPLPHHSRCTVCEFVLTSYL